MPEQPLSHSKEGQRALAAHHLPRTQNGCTLPTLGLINQNVLTDKKKQYFKSSIFRDMCSDNTLTGLELAECFSSLIFSSQKLFECECFNTHSNPILNVVETIALLRNRSSKRCGYTEGRALNQFQKQTRAIPSRLWVNELRELTRGNLALQQDT